MHPFCSSRWPRFLQLSRMALAISMMLATFHLPGHQVLAQAQGKEGPVKHPIFYRTIQIDGLSIFYREAGPKDAPTLLLLHGLPSSSRMFEPLFARLSDHYHLIAPDYPGFGHSDWPDPKKFTYTFDHYAEIMKHFTEALGLARYTLYMQDYGGPVGFRMALADFFFSSRRRHTRSLCDWSSDVCSSDLPPRGAPPRAASPLGHLAV